ncbi:MAG: serine/threonine-protein kinase [Rubripirellula sp.]
MTADKNKPSRFDRGSEDLTELDDSAPRDSAPRDDVPGDTLGRAFDLANSDAKQRNPPDDGSESFLDDAPVLSGRYDYRRLLGCGGMGEVYLVHDHVLGRNVALKVLRREGGEHVDLHRRFVEEAQIGGQLQHPGIVPIYDFGTLESGVSYFTMKYVKGLTLSDSLEKHGIANDPKAWLDPFVSICQTLAYAHSKNVIHRDLKASNVMVGAFGEVQVLDWGLAKVVGHPDEAPVIVERTDNKPADLEMTTTKGELSDTSRLTERTVTVIRTPTSPESDVGSAATDDSRTRIGSIIGTLAYMPPEQANGLVQEMDCRSDVFALGSILCRILTGYPAYHETDGRKLLAMARQGDLRECYQRLERCDCDDALKQIVRGALSPDKFDRPANAGELGQQITDYRRGIQDRLRNAELDNAASTARAQEAEQTAAAERRWRRVSTALLSVVMLVVVGSGVAGWWIAKNREALADAKRRAALVQQNQLDEEQQRYRELVARIDKELTAGATSLADVDQQMPTQNQLARAETAVQRAEEWQANLIGDDVGGVRDRIVQLRQQLDEFKDAIVLLDRIEEIRIDATDREADAPIVRSFSVEQKPHFASGMTIGPSIKAMEDWGLDLQSPEPGLQKLVRLPDWARSRIEVHLRLLQIAVQRSTPATMRDEIQWRVLSDGQYESQGGAQLVQRPDGSIEAVGKNPNCDVYTFDFPWNGQSPKLLRIEALPRTEDDGSDDLVSGPLGRASDGSACMSNLVVDLVQEDEILPIPVVSSEASYCYHKEPLRATHWNLTFAPARQQWAVFEFGTAESSSPAIAKSLRIKFHNHSVPEWGDQNFARMRLSIASNVEIDAIAANVDAIIDRLDRLVDDRWTKRLWASLEEPSLDALQQLLKDPSASNHAVDHIILLSDLVNQFADDRTVEQLRNDVDWQTKTPRIGSNASAEIIDGGWIDVKQGEYFDAKLDFLDFPEGHPAPTAFRIDTFDDSPSSDRTFQKVSILELAGRGYSYGGLVQFEKTNVMSDHVRSYDGPIQAAFNNEYESAWKFAHPPGRKICSCIVKVEFPESTEFRDGIRVRVYSSNKQGPRTKRLKRIRIFWTFDEVEWFNTQDLAYDLLQQAYVKSMDNERLLLALAENRMGNWLATGEESMGYATAAVSLRPNDANALDRYVSLTLRQNPSANSDLARRAFSLARRQLSLASNDRAISRLQDAFVVRAEECMANGNREAAAEFFQQAMAANPNRFSHRKQLARCLVSTGRYDEAETLHRQHLESFPDDVGGIVSLGYLLGKTARHDERLALLKDASKRIPNSLKIERQLVYCYAQLKEHERCLSSMRRCLDLGADQFVQGEEIAWLLSDLGRDQEAYDEMEKALKHEGNDYREAYLSFIRLAAKGPGNTEAWVRQYCRRGDAYAGTLRDDIRNALIALGGWTESPFISANDPKRRRPSVHRVHTMDNIEFLIEIVFDESPDDAQMQLVAALVFFECGRFEDALQLARRYPNSKSNGPQFLGPPTQMGIEAGCLHRLGKTEEAIPIYQKLLRSPGAIGGNLQFYSMSFLHSHPALVELKAMLDVESDEDDLDNPVSRDSVDSK